MTVSGIVLAGGASRRFGRDKLAESIDGITLLERAIRALTGIVDEVVVVIAPDRAAAIPGPPMPGPVIRYVHDPEPFGGPLVGLRAGLLAAAGSTVLVVGGDMPFMVPGVLRLLVDAAPAALADAAGVLRPLPCALDRATALPAADELLAGGERRLRALLTRLGTMSLARAEWHSQDPGGLSLVDIDEPGDLPRKPRDPDLSAGVSQEEEPGP
jgi:molybdopterin-guanine dinucleotide biosynthesis protein A